LLSAFAISFTHLNIALIMVPIVGTAFVVRGLVEKRWDFHRLLYAMGGAILGWVLRPSPIGALKLELRADRRAHARAPEGPALLFGASGSRSPSIRAFTYFGLFAFSGSASPPSWWPGPYAPARGHFRHRAPSSGAVCFLSLLFSR